MFSGLYDAIAATLNFFYSLIPDYGVAILLLTLAVMIILTPLTLRGTRSMMKMQQLQPEMKKIQQKYKDDRQKLNEELLAFYKENKINPVGGCLPLLIQLPVFFILYRVIWGLTHIPKGASGFVPKYLDKSGELYKALYHQTQMRSFGIDLSQSATKAFSESIVHALPFLVLVGLVIITGYIQQKQVSGRTTQQQANAQQQMMMKIMPAFIGFISLNIPAGVVLYFLGSNLYRMVQQAYISRTMYTDDKVIEASGREQKDEAPAKPKPKRTAAPPREQTGRSARPTGRAARFTRPERPSGRNGTDGRSEPEPEPSPTKRPSPQPRARKKKKRK